MKFILVWSLLTTMAVAETYKISGNLIVFENKNGLLVKGCEKKCAALDKVAEFKKIDLKKARSGETFHGSIGSDVCRLVYKNPSVIGVEQSRDQRAFCVFPDSSMIEINSLSKYLTDKKIIRE